MQGVDLPDSVQGYLGYMRLRLTEEIAWMQGSPLFKIMAEGGGGTFRPGDRTLLQVLQHGLDYKHSLKQSLKHCTRERMDPCPSQSEHSRE